MNSAAIKPIWNFGTQLEMKNHFVCSKQLPSTVSAEVVPLSLGPKRGPSQSALNCTKKTSPPPRPPPYQPRGPPTTQQQFLAVRIGVLCSTTTHHGVIRTATRGQYLSIAWEAPAGSRDAIRRCFFKARIFSKISGILSIFFNAFKAL